MGKIAFIFPGQGSQYVGMVKDIFENSQKARELFTEAEDAIGFNISKIMFDGPADDLRQTDVTQPAIFLHSVVLNSLIESIKPDMVAGHSLGEYSSLVCAGGIKFVDAFKLVRVRGQAMLQAGNEQKGTMAAIVGLPADKVVDICANISKENIVQCANFNSPGQIVISGSINGVHKAMEVCKSEGAKLVKELVVSGAFHSPLMESAKTSFKQKLDETIINDITIPLYPNVTAAPTLIAKEIGKLLFDQLTAPVRWEETINSMVNDGADTFIEIGPSNVLQGLTKRINPNVKSIGIDKYADLEKLLTLY
ncbi:MAG: ACP S-malonyltransferase [Ignavibacteriales bacterium]|nr:ACP S-malonyltransferase [Ignavibacteriales bacterium]